jgi:hypothetical protein
VIEAHILTEYPSDFCAVEFDGVYLAYCPCCGLKFTRKDANVVVEKLRDGTLQWQTLLAMGRIREAMPDEIK